MLSVIERMAAIDHRRQKDRERKRKYREVYKARNRRWREILAAVKSQCAPSRERKA